jgi:hypothetical protein
VATRYVRAFRVGRGRYPAGNRGWRAPGSHPAKAWALTIKSNTVAVVSDGTAVLGHGDIGRAAAMPARPRQCL